jgi:hypothetical protein
MTGAIIRCAFSVECASTCWSMTVFAAVVVTSVRRWWSIIATNTTPANLLVTLCIRRHMRIHRSSGWKCWFSEMPLRLWRELHPNAPMQLQLALRNAEKEGKSKALFKAPTGKVLPLLTWPNASAAGLIGALADAEESSTARETRFKV